MDDETWKARALAELDMIDALRNGRRPVRGLTSRGRIADLVVPECYPFSIRFARGPAGI